MAEILRILFGGAFGVALASSCGILLLRQLRLAFSRIEIAVFSFIAGSALLSSLVFLLCVTHQARRGVFQWGGTAVILWGFCELRRGLPKKTFPTASKSWMLLFYVAFSIFLFMYFMIALAPEVSPDGMGYHLGNVSRLYRNQGFVWNYHSMYSYIPQGMEMLFLVAFTFGRHSAAAMMHLAFQTALPLLLLCYGRRFGFPRIGVFAAILTYVSPLLGLDGASAYNDLTVATLVFAVFFLLQVWDENKDNKLLILVGLLSGFAFAVKYTMGIAIPFAAGFVWWRLRRTGTGRIRPLLALLTPAAVVVAPWLIRDWIWLGNPLAPFFNSWFRNPYYHPGMEEMYRAALKRYASINHYWDIPLQLALRGGYGIIGPAFLLAPLALFGLGRSQVRRLLAAGLFFALPAFMNDDARFVIPCVPFLALAIGLMLGNTRGALAAVAVFQAVACWPSVISHYCTSWTWRIDKIPIRAALRLEPATDYLVLHSGLVALKSAIELAVPPDGKVFAFSTGAEAYINRDLITSYESALGNLGYDMMMATVSGYAPNHRQRFRFLPVAARGVRVVQIASADAYWTVAEMRVYSQGRELPRNPDWRLSAWPNGWEAPLAFDNSYATRWSTWEPIRPHDRLQIDFPRPQQIDEVDLECSHVKEAHLQVEVLTGRGRWVPLTDTPDELDFEPPPGIRRAATLELKSRGIGFILARESDAVFADLKKYPTFWGITELAAAHELHFYRID